MIPIIGLMIGCYIVARSIEMIDVSLAENHGYSRKELRDIERIMRENLETFSPGSVRGSQSDERRYRRPAAQVGWGDG